MSRKITGNLVGLAPSELRLIERLYARRLDPNELISLDFAREIYRTAASLRRRIGVLITREGRIAEVAVGTKSILYLPELGRYRLGGGRLRRLRLLFSDLSGGNEVVIPSDIFTDLERLRLDLVAGVKEVHNRVALCFAHILPYRHSDKPSTQVEHVSDLARLKLDFTEFIQRLEDELSAQLAARGATGQGGAVLVGVYDAGAAQAESSMNELQELCRTAGVNILDTVIQRRQPDPKTVLGKGKLEEVVLQCLRVGADMLIFDRELRPAQWRVITGSTELKVLDRSMVILDIFAQRAHSSEGRLQVELAQLRYNLPRLVEKDAGLSRLTGGIGGRGPGETKLEVGRRRSRDRIRDLEKRIDRLAAQRTLLAKRRVESAVPLVAILGYTNAGKSTLFNALTRSDVFVEDKLFATLDPAKRRLVLPIPESPAGRRTVILSDTVGFIRQLPSDLLAAFRATLDELHQADLMLHVVDVSDRDWADRITAVERILEEMELIDVPRVLVLSKIDRISAEEAWDIKIDSGGLLVSSHSGTGLDALKDLVMQSLGGSSCDTGVK